MNDPTSIPAGQLETPEVKSPAKTTEADEQIALNILSSLDWTGGNDSNNEKIIVKILSQAKAADEHRYSCDNMEVLKEMRDRLNQLLEGKK